jgi:hypothetical protein
MVYKSVAEIFAAIDEMHQRLLSRVSELSAAECGFRLNDGAWSIAEILEHLSIIETQVCALTKKMLERIEASGGVSAQPDLESNPVSMAQYAEHATGKKFQAPKSVRPTGTVPVAESLAAMQRARAGLRALQTHFEAIDLSSATFQHPFFGPLNLYEWLAFIPMHEANHLRQIKAIINAPEFKIIGAQNAAPSSS